ncbi:DUF937 domain-containing protein [Actinocorallia sp. A-T 12471]|uniref:DUF937 domain-containing protein n=1 Tax=Actinocorallia sp. A-T 12471 TaxID=3089813 RepID=UPI0029CD7E51|nr:DUF937 domain-containing protein [Actinocorallia sp. A-T 12471]MDX6741707.1 DUF937 domain-containing protein [Actinocorallia sp. A-T 12471]
MTQRFDEETLMWLEEESSGGGAHSSGKKMAAMAGGGLVGTAVLGKALSPLAKRLARKTGIPRGQVQMILTAAAPVVISAVSAAMAKRKQSRAQSGMDHGSHQGPGSGHTGEVGHSQRKGLLGTHRHRH